jgi:hypothetical protein
LKTITHPGTLTLQVAHTQAAAEEIFEIVHRFAEWLPEEMRKGLLKTSRTNVRQIVFPEIDAQYRVVTAGDRNAGRGLPIHWMGNAWCVIGVSCPRPMRWCK